MHFKRAKGLIGALAASGFLNIILLTSIVYDRVKERSPALYCDQKLTLKPNKQTPIAAEESIRSQIQQLQTLPIEQLILKLKSLNPIEDGYTERDLALACLAAYHHFDLQRALEGTAYVLQERLLTFESQPSAPGSSIKLYSGLNNTQFSTITAFAFNERWPLTSKGIFLLLQKRKDNLDNSLLDAFYLTPEFNSVETLFKKVEPSVSKLEIVQFLLEGDWKMLTELFDKQRLHGNFSTQRQYVLLDYSQKGSGTAANLLLKTDNRFALKKLDDQQVIHLLSVLSKKTPENELFAKRLLMSPRSDTVLQMAAKRLYEYAGEPIPQKNITTLALLRFAPETVTSPQKDAKKTLDFRQQIPKASNSEKNQRTAASAYSKNTDIKTAARPKSDRLYIVQEGDTLWKVSKKFNVDVGVLRSYNKLSSDALIPNSALRIPVY